MTVTEKCSQLVTEQYSRKRHNSNCKTSRTLANLHFMGFRCVSVANLRGLLHEIYVKISATLLPLVPECDQPDPQFVNISAEIPPSYRDLGAIMFGIILLQQFVCVVYKV